MTGFCCPECGEEHPRADAIEEAEMNGYPIGEVRRADGDGGTAGCAKLARVEEMCPECGSIVTFERDVEEL